MIKKVQIFIDFLSLHMSFILIFDLIPVHSPPSFIHDPNLDEVFFVSPQLTTGSVEAGTVRPREITFRCKATGCPSVK